jgi:hypothetical protein
VDVVVHHAEIEQVDRHERALEFQDIDDPNFAMGVLGPGCEILAQKKQIPGRLCHGMNNGDFVGVYQTATGFTRHRSSPPD